MKATHPSNRLEDGQEDGFYIESSLPAGVTLSAYRRSRRRGATGRARLKLVSATARAAAGPPA